MVPAWTLVLAFAAGLAAGVIAGRLVGGRGRATEPVAPVSQAEPVATAPEPIPETAPAEDPAAAVDNVVAELERRVKGRRTEAEANRSTGGPDRQE